MSPDKIVWLPIILTILGSKFCGLVLSKYILRDLKSKMTPVQLDLQWYLLGACKVGWELFCYSSNFWYLLGVKMNFLHTHKARFCYFLGVLLDFIFLQNPFCLFVCFCCCFFFKHPCYAAKCNN